MSNLLVETDYFDFNSEGINFFLKDFNIDSSDPKSIAISLYTYVRDAFLYDPYHLNLTHEALKSSVIVTKKRAWCVEKAIVLASCARKFGIPSRVGYAIVINHIGVEKLLHYLQRKEIVFHGYVELYIKDRWVKCTPSFDSNICRISGVEVLDFDGENDSLFQAYNGKDLFMEYTFDYGTFEDVPVVLMNEEMKKYYPHLFEKEHNSKHFSFFHL